MGPTLKSMMFSLDPHITRHVPKKSDQFLVCTHWEDNNASNFLSIFVYMYFGYMNMYPPPFVALLPMWQYKHGHNLWLWSTLIENFMAYKILSLIFVMSPLFRTITKCVLPLYIERCSIQAYLYSSMLKHASYSFVGFNFNNFLNMPYKIILNSPTSVGHIDFVSPHKFSTHAISLV